MKPRRFIQKIIGRVKGELEEKRCNRIASHYNVSGYKRIYLIHIRKTGGTSLNNIFLSLSGEEPASLYAQLAATPGHRLLRRGRIFVGWNIRYINKGNYFYAFSHTPLHKLNLPEGTFTITCFRDPVKRVISHYNMLMDFSVNRVSHPCMRTEGDWLGNSFNDFLKRIPQEHLCNQIFTFSARYEINEAVERVASLSHFFFTENFSNGIDAINYKTGLNLKPAHIRKASYSAPIPDSSMANLREMLAKEYNFLDRIRALPNA